MKNRVYILLITMMLSIFIGQLAIQQANPCDSDDLFEMSLEELMEIEIASVSRRAGSLFNAAASITVISWKDIR
jgi:iron complex outermembrane receptor protein